MNVLKKSSIHSPVFTFRHRFYRVIFSFFWLLFCRFSPVPFYRLRSRLINFFGGEVSSYARVYPSVNIWSPNNIKVGRDSTLGPRVRLYNQGKVIIGDSVIISQDASICASTHDYNDPLHPLLLAPITIKDHAWICSEAFIGPGVTVGEGAVIGARAVLTKDAEPWTIYAGNPAVKIKARKHFNES